MLEVSVDGILKCDMGGKNCPHSCSTGDQTFSLEIKSPVSESIYYENKYFIPKCNYPQVLCQQFVHTAYKGLFVTYTQESVILNVVDENIDLWNNLATIIFDTYGHEVLKKPTKLHSEIQSLRKNLDKCGHENVTTLAEVPTYSCTDTDFTDAVSEAHDSPYILKRPVHLEISDLDDIIEQLKIISMECQNIFLKCSDLTRQKATELLIFMASDSNRMKGCEQMNYSHPTGYVLKGNSLPVYKMRSLVNIQRNAFKKENIPILCESFDGQWANLAFESSDGFPLTQIHLQKCSWNNACNLSRRSAVMKICDLSSVSTSDLEYLSRMRFEKDQCSIAGNISIFMKFINGEKNISLASNGGHIVFCGLLHHINLKGINPTQQELLKSQENRKTTSSTKTGLQNMDVNILSTLPQTVIDEICEEQNVQLVHNLDLHKALTSEKMHLLEDICEALHSVDDKWAGCTPENIYPDLVTDKKQLASQCRHVELNAIGDVLKSISERQLFSKDDPKVKKIDTILYLFGAKDFMDTSVRKVKSLKKICESID